MLAAVGGSLALVGVVLAFTVGGDGAGGWLLPFAFIAAGAGTVVAGVVATVRRRLAPVKAVAEVHRQENFGPLQRVRAVPRMFVDTLRGTNPVLRRYQAVLWVIALIYLVWPLDFIPDLLPLLGVSDDIGVGAWLVTSLYAESGNYLASGGERVNSQNPVAGGRSVRSFFRLRRKRA